MTISELTLKSSDHEPAPFQGVPGFRPAARMVAGGESADRGGKLRCRRDRECGGSAIALSPQQLFTWRRAARVPLAEMSAPEALFVPAVVAAPVSEPAARWLPKQRKRKAARHRAGSAARDHRAPAQICLPRLRGSGRAGSGAGASDRRRAADRGDGRAGAGEQICRPPVALSRNADLLPTGHESGTLDLGRQGRPRHRASASGDMEGDDRVRTPG